MNSTPLNCHLKPWCFLRQGLRLFIFGSLIVLLSAQLQAQVIDGGGIIPDINPPVAGGDDTGGGTTAGGSGETVDLDGAASLDLGGSDEDNRNQGFVGATADRVIGNTFVGAASQTFGALAEDGTFGGGVNDGNTSSIPGGGGGGGGGNAAGGGLGGGAGGFTGGTSGSVIRSNLRTRLRPAFDAPVIPPRATEFDFNNKLARQPSAQSLIGRYRVTVQNKTATVTGVVNSVADADRLIRQLKLQPGIYGVVNQLQVIR